MNIRFQKLHPDAVLPQYAHGPEDAAADLCSVEDTVIPAGEGRAVGTGLAFEIPQGVAGIVWDRSGLAFKHGITTLAGMIDSGYRGEVRVYLFNTGTEPFTVAKGDRIAQFVFVDVHHAQFEETAELDDSTRGTHAFGSTGGFGSKGK